MGLRFASGRGEIAGLVRERQDLGALWRERDKALIEAVSGPEGQGNQALIDDIRQQIAEIDGKLAANAARLEKEYPDYAALARPTPACAARQSTGCCPDQDRLPDPRLQRVLAWPSRRSR